MALAEEPGQRESISPAQGTGKELVDQVPVVGLELLPIAHWSGAAAVSFVASVLHFVVLLARRPAQEARLPCDRATAYNVQTFTEICQLQVEGVFGSAMANLRDVARKAGVSTATVSRSLTQAASVRPKTRSKVLRAVKELKYRPNRHARALRGRRSRTVGLVVSNLENPFFLDKFHYLEREAVRQGYEVVVESTGYDPRRLSESLEGMLARSLAGLVVSASELDASVSEVLEGVDIPLVIFMSDVEMSLPSCTRINVNDASGVQTLVRYLRSLGHRRFGVLGHHTNMGNLRARAALIDRALKASGGGSRIASAEVEDSPAGGRLGARTLLAAEPRPTAIVCLNDHVAIGVLREIREHGLSVPEDVSVVGFDNIGLSEYTNPALTTVHVPRDYLGRLAMERILSGGGASPSEVIADPQLIIRESTGPAPAL